jgi:tetratricopeptide (TPR) repeat protein
VCGSLVNIDDGILKPVHHSLRDFLLGEHPALRRITGIKPKTGNFLISRALLGYLAHPEFSCISESLYSNNFRSTHPLAEYAALYWVHHASLAESNSNLQEQIRAFFNTDNAKYWADRLLPLFLQGSVLPVPPRPCNTARFFHLFSLKSQIASCFDPEQNAEVDEHITKYLCSAYEEFLENARAQDGPASLSVMQRLLDLADVYSWCPTYQEHVAPTLHVALETASQLSSLEAQNLAVVACQALADEYKRNGKYEDAQKLLNQLLSLASDHIPQNDPKIMFALDSLGWVCMRLGQLEAAAAHLEEALGIAVEHYGPQSSLTLRSRVTLAEVLGKLGRHDEAEALCTALKEQLLQQQMNSVPLSTDSISHLNTLALIYMQEGKYDKAVDTYKIVVEDRRKLFGEEHRLALWAEMQWGLAMDQRGDREAAIATFERLITRQERVLGMNHPDVQVVKERLRRDQ